MGYQVYWDDKHNRWAGYGVPAYCDYPECNAEVNRGMDYNCGGGAAYATVADCDDSQICCGLSFCSKHMPGNQCDSCEAENLTDYPQSKEHPDWVKHVATDDSWREWREDNPELLANWSGVISYRAESWYYVSGRGHIAVIDDYPPPKKPDEAIIDGKQYRVVGLECRGWPGKLAKRFGIIVVKKDE